MQALVARDEAAEAEAERRQIELWNQANRLQQELEAKKQEEVRKRTRADLLEQQA